MHPQVLRELADVIAKPFFIIFERSWRAGKLPADRRKTNVIAVFKNGKKENSGNYRPVSLTSIPGKVIGQLILDVIYMGRKKRLSGVVDMNSPSGKHA